MWAWRVWPKIGMGVGFWRRPSSVGPTKGRETVENGRSHAVLYACVHFWESLARSASAQGMSGLRNQKVPIAFDMKICKASLCSR